jgi:hypothetical protein
VAEKPETIVTVSIIRKVIAANQLDQVAAGAWADLIRTVPTAKDWRNIFILPEAMARKSMPLASAA